MTYRELLNDLLRMSDAELSQTVQVIPPGPSVPPVELCQAIEFGAVEQFFHCEPPVATRSSDDNQHHPEQFVILTDWNPFSAGGDLAYELQDDGSLVGMQTGKVVKDGAT